MLKILTDTAADLTAADIESLNLTIAPLSIQFPDDSQSVTDISHNEFYARLAANFPQLPTTTLPSPGYFRETFDALTANGDDVLAVHISSGLSGTANAARLIAEKFGGKVMVVDSKTLSGGLRFQVIAAVRAAKAEWEVAQILARLDVIRAKTETIFTLETLEYLQRGGRIGRVAALAGALLKIKPVIAVDKLDGKYNTVGKARSVRKAMRTIVAQLREKFGDKPVWVSVMHGDAADDAAILAEMLRETLSVGKLETLRISPVLGVHTGPKIVGAAVVPLAEFDGLPG